MPTLMRSRYADVVATLALVVALGGTTYAAVSLPRNSVTTKQVKNRSLLAKDFRKGVIKRGKQGLTGPAGAIGSQGAQGLQGVQGELGPQGPAGPSTPQTIADGSIGYAQLATSAVGQSKLGVTADSDLSVFDSTGPKTAQATCPAGTAIIAGGGGITNNSSIPLEGVAAVSYDGPIPFLDGWRVDGYEPAANASSWRVIAYAICIRD